MEKIKLAPGVVDNILKYKQERIKELSKKYKGICEQLDKLEEKQSTQKGFSNK